MNKSDNIKINFGLALKELREQHDMTQEELAEELHLQSYQTINKIENGKSFVSSALLGAMCDFFQVSPSYFFIERLYTAVSSEIDYTAEIKQMLPSLTEKRLKDIYGIIQLFLE